MVHVFWAWMFFFFLGIREDKISSLMAHTINGLWHAEFVPAVQSGVQSILSVFSTWDFDFRKQRDKLWYRLWACKYLYVLIAWVQTAFSDILEASGTPTTFAHFFFSCGVHCAPSVWFGQAPCLPFQTRPNFWFLYFILFIWHNAPSHSLIKISFCVL